MNMENLLTTNDFEKFYQAAQVLVRHGSVKDAEAIILKLWESETKTPSQEFMAFAALVELRTLQNPEMVLSFLIKMMDGDQSLGDFWSQRSLSEQAVVLEW